jgi:hypothetical protein
MSAGNGFWSGMPAGTRVRFVSGLVYLVLAVAVLGEAPIVGILLLMLPILWNVLVIWMGSEKGAGFGPYSQKRETAFVYVLRHVWRAPVPTRLFLGALFAGLVVFGLGWIGTEGLRAEVAKPTLTVRVTTAADTAAQSTKKTLGGWVSTAKGWFTPSDGSQSSP